MAAAAVIGKILGVVGGVLGAAGQYRNELSRAAQLKFESYQATNNAELARQDQVIVAETSAQERAAIAKTSAQTRGSARASFAASNVMVDTGSALEVDIAQAEQAAAEMQRSRDEEAIAKHRLETERQGLLAEARLKRTAAKNVKKSAKISAVGGVLQSVGGAMGR